MTTLATWTTTDAAVATVTQAHGPVTGVAPGTTSITATYNGLTGTATITVTVPTSPSAARFVYGVMAGG